MGKHDIHVVYHLSEHGPHIMGAGHNMLGVMLVVSEWTEGTVWDVEGTKVRVINDNEINVVRPDGGTLILHIQTIKLHGAVGSV